MNDDQTHAMELLHSGADGVEEWHCPTCGRRFLMSWPPEYTKTVLVLGDVYATHLGGKGGLQMGAPAIMDVETYLPEPRLDDDLLGPWRRAFDE